MNTHVYSRQSALNDRHRPAWIKNQVILERHAHSAALCDGWLRRDGSRRNRAGLFDVRALRLIDVSGKNALAALNEMLTSDIGKIKPGASSISNIVDDNGSLIDDVLVYCDGPNAYRISHGGGALEDVLPSIANGRESIP